MRRWAVLLLATATAAHAEQPPRRALQTFVSAPVCVNRPASLDALNELVNIEVRAHNVQNAPSPEGARLGVTVLDCDGTHTRITLESADGRRREQRELDTTGIDPDTRPRVIALAIAELVRVTHVFDPAPPKPPAPAPPPAPKLAERFVAVQAYARFFPAGPTALLGPHLELTLPLARIAELGIGARVTFGNHDDALGSVALGLATGRLVPRFVARPHARLALAAGPSLELGAGWASGSATDPSTVASSGTETVLALGVEVLLRAELTPRVWLLGTLEGAGMLAGFRAQADTRSAGGVRGIGLGASAGAAFAF